MVIGENNDQPPRVMHFCKVCNKGFSRGGALGGHMRSHGIEDVINAKNNEEANYKRMHDFLRTTNNRIANYDTSTGTSSKEEKVMAKCLVMLSNGTSSKEEKDMAKCLVMLSNEDLEEEKANSKELMVKGNFQCKACKKVFNSHQALGGHRASHKRVKGCFAARFENIIDDDDDDIVEYNDATNSDAVALHLIDLNRISEAPNNTLFSPLKKKLKVHECSICHRVFSSGQALGGHKRCHWIVSNMAETNAVQLFKKPMISSNSQLLLDLNLPTMFDDTEDHDNSSKFEALSTRIYLPPRSKEEICREVNLPKLSEMREMNLDGNCSTWLQVGINRPDN